VRERKERKREIRIKKSNDIKESTTRGRQTDREADRQTDKDRDRDGKEERKRESG